METIKMLVSRSVWNYQGELVKVKKGATVDVTADNAKILIEAKLAEKATKPTKNSKTEAK
jgi:hypothetical protein